MSPNAQAVCSHDGDFTYQELWDLSSRLAHYLRSSGVQKEVIVPICLDKSRWNVVAQLAVLKAGGASASIDPQHPQDRIDGILDDTEARLVLTEPKYHDLFRRSAQVVLLSSEYVEQLPDDEAAKFYSCPSVLPRNAAFVVFTSGSTGKPKGIVQEHGAYSTSMAASASIFASRPGRRHLAFAAHTFDNSISDVFVTLANGGCVCIPSDYDRLNNLADAIVKMRCNQAELTPTVARLLHPRDVPGLEMLMLTGESATQENLVTWGDLPNLHLVNIYGPAEVTILTTVKSHLHPNAHPLDIGTAVGGRCWITDPNNHNKLTPIGAIGELLVEGPFLARGYLNDQKKTEAAFITDPTWARDGMPPTGRRFYHTGDIARYNEDGSIRLVGRNDTQIKLRGQRIELGGVEYQLCSSMGVRHGAVIFPRDGPCRQNLVSLLSFHDISREESGRETITLVHPKHASLVRERLASVREHLAARLPTYMIPTIWLVLNDLPLMTSGKLHRKLLITWVNEISDIDLEKAKDLALVKSQAHCQIPSTKAEELLLKVISHVLNYPPDDINLSNSFLQLGGKSGHRSILQIALLICVKVIRYRQCLSEPDVSPEAVCLSPYKIFCSRRVSPNSPRQEKR